MCVCVYVLAAVLGAQWNDDEVVFRFGFVFSLETKHRFNDVF